MSAYLSEKYRLTVISDTAMSGIPFKPEAFEPVVREIDQLAASFKSVDWMGYRLNPSSPKNHKIPSSNNLMMIPCSDFPRIPINQAACPRTSSSGEFANWFMKS